MDNLPAATKYFTESLADDGSTAYSEHYEKGFALGFVGSLEMVCCCCCCCCCWLEIIGVLLGKFENHSLKLMNDHQNNPDIKENEKYIKIP